MQRWTATYGADIPWSDTLVLHRWAKPDRVGTTIVVEEVQAMGILILDGEWEDVA